MSTTDVAICRDLRYSYIYSESWWLNQLFLYTLFRHKMIDKRIQIIGPLYSNKQKRWAVNNTISETETHWSQKEKKHQFRKRTENTKVKKGNKVVCSLIDKPPTQSVLIFVLSLLYTFYFNNYFYYHYKKCIHTRCRAYIIRHTFTDTDEQVAN